jgi:hypothetical protein
MATYPALCLNVETSVPFLICFVFADGVIQHTQNCASIAWVVYSTIDEIVSLGELFLGPTTNNIT